MQRRGDEWVPWRDARLHEGGNVRVDEAPVTDAGDDDALLRDDARVGEREPDEEEEEDEDPP